MSQDVSITLSKSIVYVYGTVNGVEVEFTYIGDGVWSTTADKTDNGRYEISITANDSLGNAYTYYTVKYYGINLITDRTQADIVNDTAKAYIDFEDLNRIEAAILFISERLNAAGYENTITSRSTEWVMQDIRTQEDMDRLRDNIRVLRNAFGTCLATTPDTPTNITYKSIEQANAIEQILVDLDALETNMEMEYRYCGTEVIAGEEISL